VLPLLLPAGAIAELRRRQREVEEEVPPETVA
jgi:hypothetical protein